MDRVIKIKNQSITIEESIRKEESIDNIKHKLKDKKNIDIKRQRLIFKGLNI